jgi:large conductance mechanosensitive channel
VVRAILMEFRDFMLRGNIVELAVAVVIGTAFAALVASLVADLLTPIVAAIFGQPDFSDLTFSINDSEFRYGNFINAVITFVSVAAAIFFFVVKPLQVIQARRAGTEAAATTRPCPECLSEIPLAARRCSFCTSEVGAAG